MTTTSKGCRERERERQSGTRKEEEEEEERRKNGEALCRHQRSGHNHHPHLTPCGGMDRAGARHWRDVQAKCVFGNAGALVSPSFLFVYLQAKLRLSGIVL